MYLKPLDIPPGRAAGILMAAENAMRAIPPAFPLSATVAVNPFLGQTGEGLATACARLSRVAGAHLMRPRADYASEVAAGRITDHDLCAALNACDLTHKPANLASLKAHLHIDTPAPEVLPTVADLASRATGTDWTAIIARTFGLWAAGRFDRGQALWQPAAGTSAYAAWRDWACNDLTPEIAGLRGFCAHVAAAPDTPDRAILRAADALGLSGAASPTAFHRLLMDLGGWAMHARWLMWEAELEGGSDTTLLDLLAIRLIWDEALMTQVPQVRDDWARVRAAHALPVLPTADQVVDAILQDAAERGYQRRLAQTLTGGIAQPARPVLQAALCIDVRSEVFRRALESLDPGIATLGFAGFFGLPVAHRPFAAEATQGHLPVLLSPALVSEPAVDPRVEAAARIAARASRAWGRFRQAAVSSFAFVEAAGPFYGARLVRDALCLGRTPPPAPKPQIVGGLSADAKATTGTAVLRAMSLTAGHARLVLLLGHGARVTNNPHESAYHCGACAGQTGEVSARLLAGLLNDPETRAGLPAHGLTLPPDTLFVAGLHDTTTDTVTLFDEAIPQSHADDLDRARNWLADAGRLVRTERAERLPGATATTIAGRAHDWAEVRPEWGLAGCAAFIAAPRASTAGRNLGGRAFLHEYAWEQDAQFKTLELILTAPVVVASWISLHYYGASLAPQVFGGGNKLIHNVTGGIGVVQGNGGVLRPGLPWQAVHDGAGLAHDPLRLSVLIDAPTAAMADVLSRHPSVQALFDNGWLHLLALQEGRVVARYRPGLTWTCAADPTPRA